MCVSKSYGIWSVRLKADEWNSGKINWLFDVIAPNQKRTTSVIANFRQVLQGGDSGEASSASDGGANKTRGGEGGPPDRETNNDGDLRIHPLITRLVDPETLKKMGAAPVEG